MHTSGNSWSAKASLAALNHTNFVHPRFHLRERSPTTGGGNGNPLRYSCLENPMDRGAWWATGHGVTKSGTWLSVHYYSPWHCGVDHLFLLAVLSVLPNLVWCCIVRWIHVKDYYIFLENWPLYHYGKPSLCLVIFRALKSGLTETYMASQTSLN